MLRPRLSKLRIFTSSSKILLLTRQSRSISFLNPREIVFSRVGFDRTNKQALVCVGRICGPLGYLILLTESREAWKVDDKYLFASPGEVAGFGRDFECNGDTTQQECHVVSQFGCFLFCW